MFSSSDSGLPKLGLVSMSLGLVLTHFCFQTTKKRERDFDHEGKFQEA